MGFIADSEKNLNNLHFREKTMRSIQFGLLLASPCFKTYPVNRRKALEEISHQIGATRVLLRCFDDLPMLKHTLSYGLGKHETNYFSRILTLIGNASSQLYFPVEHFAWLQDRGIISGSSQQLWRFGLVLWASSLVSAILKCLIRRLEIKKAMSATTYMKERHLLKKQLMKEYINLIMFSADLLNALNWLSLRPWGGKPFPTWLVGFLGLTSSLIGLYNLLSR